MAKSKVQLKLPEGISNPYHELDLEPGAGKDEVSKAYKNLARKFHPDKQARKSDAEKAAAEARFLRIKAANDFLSDAEQKALLDEEVTRTARAAARKVEREGAMDERRRAMKRRLDEDEARASAPATGPGAGLRPPASGQQARPPGGGGVAQQQRAREKARAEELREENRGRREAHAAEQERMGRDFAAASAAARLQRESIDLRTVQVKWKRKVHAYGDDDLAALFRPFGGEGGVQEVRMVGTKGNAALVVLSAPDAAAEAEAYFEGHASMRVTVKAGKPPAWASPTGARPGGMPAASPIQARDLESLDARHARQQAEREKLRRRVSEGKGSDDEEEGGSGGDGGDGPTQASGMGLGSKGGPIKKRTSLTHEELVEKENAVFAMMLGSAEG